jgi:O-antigen/teichoic acid export membrane protein
VTVPAAAVRPATSPSAPAGAPCRGGAGGRRGRWWAGQPRLARVTAALLGTAGVTSALGLAFWWLAARMLPLTAVGYGAAAVSAMTVVGTFGMAGLNTALVPQLASRPDGARGLLTTALTTSALVSALIAAAFWAAGTVAVPQLAPYLRAGPQAVTFIAGSALTGAALVADEALLGLLGGGPQLWRNTAWAVAKLGALAGFTVLWHDRLGAGILTAWTAGTAVSMVPVVVLLRRRAAALVGPPRWRALRGLGRPALAHTWLNDALLIPGLTMPLVVTGLLSPAAGGAFSVAWSIVTLANWVSFHFTSALYATGVADPGGLAAKLRFTLRACGLAGLIGVPVLAVAAHPLLRLFGPQYAARATVPLQLLGLGYFGSALKSHYVALRRISGRITRAGMFATVTCATRLGAAVAGGLAGGLPGLSLALAAEMSAEGAFTIPAVRAALRGRNLQAAPAPALAAAPRGPAGQAAPRGPAGQVAAAPGREAGDPRPVRVCYYLQTHSRPAQVTRLVRVIKEGSPDSVVLISHDAAAPPLDSRALGALPGVHVLTEPGGYGDFSHLDRYLAAVDWLDAQGVAYDWLENITGQDYPLRPIAAIEHDLARSDVDGYLLYAPVFPAEAPPGADQGAAPGFRLCAPFDATMRYRYRHWRIGRPTPAKQRWLRPAMALNLVQPWIRVSLGFSSVGVRRRTPVFTSDFVCYGGWFFCTLSAACARYARDFAREHPGLVRHLRTVLAPEEVFLQSVLVNSGRFRFEPDAKRYIDLRGSRNNHSRTLGMADLEAMLASGANWARKFDAAHDAQVLDALDQRIREPR